MNEFLVNVDLVVLAESEDEAEDFIKELEVEHRFLSVIIGSVDQLTFVEVEDLA